MTTAPASSATPALSVIVLTDTAAAARPLFDALRDQTARDRLELVVAAPQASHQDVRAVAGDEFGGVRCVDFDARAGGMGAGRVAAIRVAQAPIVVLTETHCFPEPDWAAALIDAHAHGEAAIGPVFLNGNPERIVSQAQFVCHYGPFAEPLVPGPYADAPGHNSSYRREVLLAIDDELPELFGTEYLLHRRLKELGHELGMAPAARVKHVNVSRFGSAMRETYLAGRLFASARRRGWSLGRRVSYALAFPALALVRFRRHAADSRRIGGEHHPRVLVPMLAGLMCSSLGEAAGYLAGEGRAEPAIIDMELHRDRYLKGAAESERRLIEAVSA